MPVLMVLSVIKYQVHICIKIGILEYHIIDPGVEVDKLCFRMPI